MRMKINVEQKESNKIIGAIANKRDKSYLLLDDDDLAIILVFDNVGLYDCIKKSAYYDDASFEDIILGREYKIDRILYDGDIEIGLNVKIK